MDDELTGPAGGLDAWAVPDAATPPAARIDSHVPMRLLDRHGDWGYIECDNGWRAWVDARRLRHVPRRSAVNPGITTIGHYTITAADLIPAVGIVLGALLPWLRGGIGVSTGFDVPATFLLDSSPGPSVVKVGWLLAVAAPSRTLRFLGYGVALATLAIYVVRLDRLLHQVTAGQSVWHVLGVGVYVAAGAALVGLGVVAVARGR